MQQILIIDDEAAVVDMLGLILASNGFSVTAAYGAAAGLERFSLSPHGFDLILLDLFMPGMNGEDLFGKLRLMNPNIKIMMMSGLTGDEKLHRLLRSGAVGFLEKPSRVNEILSCINRALIPAT